MAKPTVLIFIANDANQPLPNLAAEAKSIQRILNSAPGREYETAVVPSTEITDIIEEFNVSNRAIEVIHYAGHADDETLRFSDDDVEAKALAAKVKSHGHVKVVFLNGCATHQQVQYFHEVGVPFVIATARPVEDQRATWMATQFYQYLILKQSIQKAMAEVVIDTQQLTKQISFSNERGMLRRSEMKKNDDQFEWALYINDNAEDQDFSLPIKAFAKLGQAEISHTLFLNNLIFSLSKSDNNNIAEIKKIASNIQRGFKLTDKNKASALLKTLPYPLGIRLRQIVAEPEDRNQDYFSQLLFDYVMLFETLLYQSVTLLLSQLWQDKNKAIQNKPENVQIVLDFLREDRMAEPFENYIPIIKLSLNWVKKYNPSVVIPFSNKLIPFLESEEFLSAADFFYLHKQYFWQKVRMNEEEAIENCFIAQEQLNKVFPYFTFIPKYTLASIRGINVMNFRHLPQDFEKIENTVSKLVVNEVDPVPLAGQFKLESMLENRTVLSFYESEPEIGHSTLNLFPFIIDRNVYAGESNSEVDLYMFIGFFAKAPKEEACYHFISVKNPGKIWQFDTENIHDNSFLHIDEETTHTHKHNHLMANAWEFKNYLDQYREFVLAL